MQPQEQPVVRIGGLEIRYLMDGTLTGAGSGMFELTVGPGARVPPAHSHSRNEEIVYVLEGTFAIGSTTRYATSRRASACILRAAASTPSATPMTARRGR